MKILITIFVACLVFSCARTTTRTATVNSNSERTSYGPTPSDLKYIKKETIGGKLDFAKTLPTNTTHFQVGTKIYGRQSMALYNWGSAVHKLKVKTPDHAVQLYEEIKGVELNEKEKEALTHGFNDYRASNY